ncbi:Integrin alpha-5 [Collichthys lucidus]|uniref:Integrin alpha-5 n=1 Tax=Collichthys lucidus TaxID=240159 RepID=A0A4U5TTY5_COLLU|nr:Integrin alpha-5 [Collichthys lucidus]
MFNGTTGSLFGFSVDFHTFNNKSFVVIGAPKANTNQSGVMEGGEVFLCPWSPEGGTCDIINFDLEGDEVYRSSEMLFHTFKSGQWFGASVRSVTNTHLLRQGAESGQTPVGNCFLLDQRTGMSTPFSPCRGNMLEEDYKRMNNRNDQRYCEVGFSIDITKVITVGVSDITASGKSNDPIPYVTGVSQSDERGGYDLYRGYSVASGQLTGDSTPVSYHKYFCTISQVVLYLQRRHTSFSSQPDQSLIGFSVYGRFGSALAVLGDVDMDGYHDVAVGAPWSGDHEQGQVFIYLGNSNGLSAIPSQVIDSPLPSSRTAFGFTLRGATDIDGNGYPDLLVGAWAADRALVYRSQAVIQTRVLLSLLPDLNPEVKRCDRENRPVSCFDVQMCIYVSGHRIPQETALGVELQLDKMKQPMARRTLLLSTNQPQDIIKLMVQREVGVACINQTAYLRSEEDIQDKLSPIFITVNVSILNTTQHALLHGQTHAAAQVNHSSNEVLVKVQVKAEVSLEIRGGSSPPEVLLPLPDWQPAMHPKNLEEVGPLVEHVYEVRQVLLIYSNSWFWLRNYGPSAVNARLTVDFPSTWRHHFLLYVFSRLLLLSMLCVIFWKLGFFKRTRPPTDDDDDNEQHQMVEESRMTT